MRSGIKAITGVRTNSAGFAVIPVNDNQEGAVMLRQVSLDELGRVDFVEQAVY